MASVIGSKDEGEERAVPGMTDLGNVVKHIARYNIALLYAQGKEVVDAACGSGYGSLLLSMVASRVTGIDCSPEACAYAREHFSSPKVTYKEQDLLQMDEMVDLVVSFETTEHLKDLRLWEERVHKSLKPGGLFVFSVPLNEAEGFNPYHLQRFTLESARTIFASLKLVDELIQQGVNFYQPKTIATDQPYLAYIGIRQKI